MFWKKKGREIFFRLSPTMDCDKFVLTDENIDNDKYYSVYIDNRYINIQRLTSEFKGFLLMLQTNHLCVDIDDENNIVKLINTPEWSITIKPKKHTTSDITIVGFKNGFKLFQLELFEDYNEKPIIKKESNLRFTLEEEDNQVYFVVYLKASKDREVKVIQTLYDGSITGSSLMNGFTMGNYYNNPESYWF